MAELTDAKIQTLLSDKRAELSGEQPAEKVVESEEKVVESNATEPTVPAEKAGETTPTEAKEPEEKVKPSPDLTWLSPEYREGFKQLPEPLQKYLKETRASILTEADRKFQAAAKERKALTAEQADAAKWRELDQDKGFRADVLSARQKRLGQSNGETKTEKAPRKWGDTLLAGDDGEVEKTIREVIREEVAPFVDERLSAPARHAGAIDEAIASYFDGLDVEMPDSVRQAALEEWKKDLNPRDPYRGLTADMIPLALPGYVRAARAEAAVMEAAKVARVPTPAPATAKAASIKGLGPQGPSKPLPPAYQREKRPPTAEEFFRAKVAEAGLSDEQLTALRMGGQLTLR